MSSSPVRLSCQTAESRPLALFCAMRGKSLVRMKAPGMHASGPRPKSHLGLPTITSSPTLAGLAQLRWPPPGWQVTASCWSFGLVGAVLLLWNTTSRLPSGRTIGSEPWSKSQSLTFRVLSKKLPAKQRADDRPLISSGLDQVTAWSVDMEPKMADEQ